MITKVNTSSVVRTPDTSEGPSAALWGKINWLELLDNPAKGICEHHDFSDLPPHASSSGGAVSGALGRYLSYIYQGGAIAAADATGFARGMKLSSDGDNEGAAIGPNIAKFLLAAAQGYFVAEWRLKVSTAADTTFGIFAGLIEGGAIAAAVPITTSGAIADKNCIGFHRLEADGDKLDIVWKADGVTQVTLLEDAITLVADTYVKVGMIFDPEADDSHKLTFYKDGVPLTTFGTAAQMAAAAFPSDAALGMCAALMNAAGSSPGTSSFDWMRVAQLRAAA